MQTVLRLPDSLSWLLDLLLVVAPIIQTTAIVGLLVVGLVLLLAASVGVCCTAGMLHASGRPRAHSKHAEHAKHSYKYSQVASSGGIKPAELVEHLVSLSLCERDSDLGKGRA